VAHRRDTDTGAQDNVFFAAAAGAPDHHLRYSPQYRRAAPPIAACPTVIGAMSNAHWINRRRRAYDGVTLWGR
jgi:hypothetical protein